MMILGKKLMIFISKNVVGVGDIVSTMYDTNIFLTKLFANKIISKSSLQEMIPDKDFFLVKD